LDVKESHVDDLSKTIEDCDTFSTYNHFEKTGNCMFCFCIIIAYIAQSFLRLCPSPWPHQRRKPSSFIPSCHLYSNCSI